MKQLLSGILSLGAIALLITSCATSQQEESPAPTSKPNPAVRREAFPGATVPPLAGATEAGKPASTQITVAGLIPSTNPEQRRQQVTKGRKDPFALVPLQPTLQQPESQLAKPQPQIKPSIAPKKTPITVKPKPQNPAVPMPPALPPLPELARGVVVFGVIQIDGTPQVIVKAPNEEFTRYVGIGQLLANGQVRVKRIEGLRSPSPVVVLEELGQDY